MGKIEWCAICGNPNTEIHHIFYGTANRKLSEEYGYVVPLCREHHTGAKGVHFDKEKDIGFKRAAQTDFESRYGDRSDFIKIFGRSYL